MRYEVQGVLAATYRGKAKRALEQGGDRVALTHVVVLGSDGQAVKVLCRTVKYVRVRGEGAADLPDLRGPPGAPPGRKTEPYLDTDHGQFCTGACADKWEDEHEAERGA